MRKTSALALTLAPAASFANRNPNAPQTPRKAFAFDGVGYWRETGAPVTRDPVTLTPAPVAKVGARVLAVWAIAGAVLGLGLAVLGFACHLF